MRFSLFGNPVRRCLSKIRASAKEADAHVRTLEKLLEKGMSQEEAAWIFEAIADPALGESSAKLIWALREFGCDQLVESLVALYPKLSAKSQHQILVVLTAWELPSATLAAAKLFSTATDEVHSLPHRFGRWRSGDWMPETVVPCLVSLLTHPNAGYQAGVCLLAYLARDPSLKAHFTDVLPSLLDYRRAFVEKWLRKSGLDYSVLKNRWDENYQPVRTDMSLLLDLFGHLGGPGVIEAVSAHVSDPDPKLAFVAIQSAYQLGLTLPQKEIERIAADAEMRKWLYDFLNSAGRLDLFPKEFLSRQRMAESDMVNWLAYPTELERVPDEIELGKIVSVPSSNGEGREEYFVFKFRTFEPHWAAKKGWMAGISGPFQVDGELESSGAGGTFSRLDPWESMTPERHFETIVGNVQEFWKSRAKGL